MIRALIVYCAQYLILLAPLIVAFVFWQATANRRRLLVLRGAVVLVAAVLSAKVSGLLYHEVRPFVVHHTIPLIPHTADNGFPSDHTLLAFA